MTDDAPNLTDTDGPGTVAGLLTELAGMDELTRRRRVHEAIRALGGCTAAVQQEFRDAIIGAGYLKAGDWRSALSEAKKAHKEKQRAQPRSPENRYVAEGGCLYLADDVGQTLLAKFVPLVVADITRDDGAERTSILRIRVMLPSGRSGEVDVPPERLGKAREWATRAVGASAVILPGTPRVEDHVWTAAQILAADRWDTIVEYAHTGWRTIDGCRRFLSASGALGAAGLDSSYHVDLGNPRLNGYALPDPSAVDAVELRAAVVASLGLRHLAPGKVMVPMMAAAYRAPLPILPETSVFVVGQSGSLKTAISALMCQHFGPALDHKGLPAEWKSTANALETTAHALANVLFVIDDYAPQAADDPRRLAAMADRVLRGVANTSGRERLRPDGTLRPSRPPRAQVLTTGEDIPPGQSLRARLTITEATAGSVDKDKLTTAQKQAAAGVFALAMAGFIRWLAAEQDADNRYVARLRQTMVEFRVGVSSEGRHLRTPEATAGLLTGWAEYLRYAEAIGALTADQSRQIMGESTATLTALADDQAAHSDESGAAEIYLRALTTALIGGHAHLASQATGQAPGTMPQAWGWQEFRDDWRPRGTCIGWLSEMGDIYLDSGTAYEVARAHADKGGTHLSTTRITTHKRLREKGYLASTDGQHIEVVRVVMGRRTRVLHLRPELLGGVTDGDSE